MSSYADIFIDNTRIFTYRNEINPETLSLFRPDEFRTIASTDPDAPTWLRYVSDTELANEIADEDEELQL